MLVRGLDLKCVDENGRSGKFVSGTQEYIAVIAHRNVETETGREAIGRIWMFDKKHWNWRSSFTGKEMIGLDGPERRADALGHLVDEYNKAKRRG